MPLERISTHIYQLKTWLIWPINVWYVVKAEDVILIDTGMSFMANQIIKEGRKLGDLKSVYLTHGHSDHAGAVNKLVKYLNIEFKINELDIPYTEGDIPFPRRKRCQKIVKKNILTPLSDNDQLLESMGIEAIHAPGHSPGHTVFYHKEDSVLLAGDLYTIKNNKISPPMRQFTADMGVALKNGERILKEINPDLLAVCHGGTLTNPLAYLKGL